jgi:alginate O-acetyltransferase complex protein AlgI
MGTVVNQVFDLPADLLNFHYAWAGIICFTLQIYFDFSGYSDMAIGLARVFGFRLRENFNLPYISTSFTEFWRRWHISLSTWIREYLYIPLGGNQVSTLRMYVNLWICFLLSGLWHGANWTFVLWGAYNGFFLILDKLCWLKLSVKLPHFLRVGLTLFFIMLGWVLFRAKDITQVKYYLKAMFSPWHVTPAYIDMTPDITCMMLLAIFIGLIAMTKPFALIQQAYLAARYRVSFEGILFAFFGFLALCKIMGVTYNPFLYFRF